MRICYTGLLLLLLGWSACTSTQSSVVGGASEGQTYTVGLGSCSHHQKVQAILWQVIARKPDVFIYLGDNIYGDTRDMEELRRKYAQLAANPSFQALREQVPLLATWDDHDYGENDAGRYYPYKEESRAIFLDFWKEPAASERRQHSGVYHSLFLKDAPLRLQVILLDTRSFRDDLIHYHKKEGGDKAYKNDYRPNPSPDSTFLGAEQWAWLKEQLQQPADVRLIASSNQFAHRYNGWESWTNVPHEQTRFLKLIQQTGAQGVVFMSGDVHWGELSKWNNGITSYPIYDLTSSGLTQNWSDTEPNAHRVGPVVRQNNFGLIEIQTSPQDTTLTFKLVTKRNQVAVQHRVALSQLR